MRLWRPFIAVMALSVSPGLALACEAVAPTPMPVADPTPTLLPTATPEPPPTPTLQPTPTPEFAPETPTVQEENVPFENEDITLRGTLTLPDTAGPHQAIVQVPGSGPMDRDSGHPSVPGFLPHRSLAGPLTDQGVAVLGYDERGMGGSTGERRTANSADLSTDTEAALGYPLTREDINPEQIGILCHSNGPWTAAMVAARHPQLAYVVSMGGHAVAGYDLLLAQVLALYGELDVQVDLEQNRPALEAALEEAGNEDVTVE